MRTSKRKWMAFAAMLALAVSVSYGIHHAVSADHNDSTTTKADKNADINDLYAFTTGAANDTLVLIMTVHPFITPSEAATTYLNPDYLYQFKIDNTGDFVEDKVIQVKVNGTGAGQTVQVYGPETPVATGPNGNKVLDASPALEGTFDQVLTSGSLKGYAGVRDDPFFFDLLRYRAILDTVRVTGMAKIGFSTPGANTFLGANTIAIAVQLPKSMVTGSSTMTSFWATSSRKN